MSTQSRLLRHKIRFVTTVSAVVGIVAGLFGILTLTPYGIAKLIVEHEMSKIFKQAVTIESMTGNIISVAKFKGIRFQNHPEFGIPGTVLEIGEATAHYSLLKTLRHRGDFAAGTHTLRIKKMTINAHRNTADKWNVLMILPPLPPGVEPMPLTFTGRVYIEKSTILIRDDHGWANQKIDRSFNEKLTDLSGVADFKDIYNSRIAWSTNLGTDQSPTLILGNLNTFTGQWDFRIRASGVSLKKWGPYVLPQAEFSLSSGRADVDAQIRSKYFPKTGEFPMWYDVGVQLRNSQFRLSTLGAPASKIQGSARLHNNQFLLVHARRAVGNRPGLAEALIKDLKRTEIIDTDGHIQITVKDTTSLAQRLPKKWNGYLATLYPLIYRPTTIIDINVRSGHIGPSTFSGAGLISLDKGQMAFQLKSPSFNVKSLQQLFPTLGRWKISGSGSADLTITGPLTSPKIDGQYHLTTAKAFGLPVRNLSIAFGYNQRALAIKSTSGTIYEGPIDIIASINFTEKTAMVDATLFSSNLKTHLIGTGIVKGSLTTKVRLTGPSNRLEVSAHSTSTQGLTWKNQRLYTIGIDGSILDGQNMVFRRLDLGVNGSDAPIRAFGLVKNWLYADFAYTAPSLLIRDIQPGNTDTGRGNLTGKLSAVLTTEFWDSPPSTTTITANGTISDLVLYGHHFKNTTLDITMTPSQLLIRNLVYRSQTESLEINGVLKGKLPEHLYIKTSQFRVPATSIVQQLIPAAFKPFSGLFSGSAVLDSNESTPSLTSIRASGNIRIDDAIIRGQSFDGVRMVGHWDGQKLFIDQSLFQKNKSILSISGDVDLEKNIDIRVNAGTTLNLMDFRTIIQPLIGQIDGQGTVYGTLKGNLTSPKIDFTLAFEKIEWGGIQIKSIKGGLGVDGKKITASKLIIQPKEGEFAVSGYFNLEPILAKDHLPFDYDIDVTAKPISLTVLAELIELVRREWLLRADSDSSEPAPKIRNSNITVKAAEPPYVRIDSAISNSANLLYSIVPGTTHSLDILNQVNNSKSLFQQMDELGLSEYVYGTFSGKFKAKTQVGKNPKIDAYFECSDATLSFLRGKKIELGISSGQDSLNYRFKVEKGDMGGTEFNLFDSEGVYDSDGYLTITKSAVSVNDGKSHSIVTGRFPLSAYWVPADANNPMDLRLTWVGDDINILSILIPHVKRVSNKGVVVLRAEGPVSRPVLSTEKVELVDAWVMLNDQMSPLISPLRINRGTFSIKENVIHISDLGFQWKGIDTQPLGSDTPETNKMILNGTVSLDDIKLAKADTAVLGMNLQFSNAKLTVNFPQIYHGQLEARNLKIKGQYTIPISKEAKTLQRKTSGTEQERGPLISGEIDLFEGELSMPTIGERKLRPNFLLNIQGRIKQNARLVGSLVGEGLLADVANRFDLSLAETISAVIVSGALNAPKIQNSIIVSKGYINLLNRQFEILSIDRQREYFRSNQYKIHNNTVEFQTDYSSPKNRLIPQLNISALTIIEPLIVTTNTTKSDKDTTKYSHVLVNIVGSAYSLQGFQFEKYVSTRADTIDRLEYRGTYGLGNGSTGGRGDSSDIAKLLAPELLDTDPNNPNAGNDRFLTQLGTGAVNYISQVALRGVEQSLAKNIGVDNVQINYNLGDAVFKNLSNQTVGVSLGKSLFSNKLFIRARTDVDIERRKYANTFQLSDIELTYYLERYLSLNYSNFLDDTGKSRNRYNIKYSYDF